MELDNNQRFITNFRYNLKPTISKDPYLEKSHKNLRFIKTSDEAAFNSVCSQTMVGLVQKMPTDKLGETNDGNYKYPAQCFIGKQLEKYDVETTNETDIGPKMKASNIISYKWNSYDDKQTAFVQLEATTERQNFHLEFTPSDFNDELIQLINENSDEVGFKANPCMHQKNHPNFGKECNESTSPLMLAQIDEDQAKAKFGEKSNAAF